MGMLYITEGNALGTPLEGGHLPIMRMPPVAEQAVAFTSTSEQSSPFNTATHFIRVESDTICSIAIGPNPTAQTISSTQTGTGASGTARLNAGVPEYFAVTPGHSIAVITTV